MTSSHLYDGVNPEPGHVVDVIDPEHVGEAEDPGDCEAFRS